ncbi:unnamed protein product [Moneuplotes crassus]|uniref:Uncharacterized protein n=1 Tax=Euplotes crassus TaxID=5936 RepID=A0AAD1X9R1_EUPCR|nr:unnamed protein product [Moneuplotes crassus]
MASKIKEKRINSELTMLDKLPEGYLTQYKELQGGGIRVDLAIERTLIQSELLPDNIESFNFSIICDSEFPFKGPQVQCNSNFLQMSICDQRDLFINICRTRWAPSNTLYEISKLIPEFISDALISEASDQRKFLGKFNLGEPYYVGDYYGNFDVWKFKDKHNMFIDYTKSRHRSHKPRRSQSRYLIVTDTGLMVCEPTVEDKDIAICRGWNTLYRLHKVRREKDNPKVISFVWDDDMMMEWTLTFEDPDQFINNICFRMETLGCKYERKEYIKKMILEKDVSKAGFLENIDFKSRECLDLIAIYEDLVNTELTIENINSLTSLYQKAIEYFSAQDSSRYEDFLNRNRNLLQREDVQTILMSLEVEPQPEEGKEERKETAHPESINPTFDHQQQESPKEDSHFIIGSEGSESEKAIPEVDINPVPIHEGVEKLENEDLEHPKEIDPSINSVKQLDKARTEESKNIKPEEKLNKLSEDFDIASEDKLVNKFNQMYLDENNKSDEKGNEEDENSAEELMDSSNPEVQENESNLREKSNEEVNPPEEASAEDPFRIGEE